MIDITDKKFWDKVNALAPTAEQTVKEMFTKADQTPLTVEEAEATLDALLAYSHLRMPPVLRKVYPTAQFTKNRLLNTENLWWTDHYTGGINEMSTLSWFSAQKVTKKNGKKGLPGASTHFVLGRHGYPFYIIPIWHGAWHEPARNADSLSIELVNPGALKSPEAPDTVWHRGLGTVPADMIAETPPVRMQPPYRGAAWLMPFTPDQLKNLIILKRIVLALRGGRLTRERMTQHSVWRKTKLDMGPLFPIDDVNRAAFECIPVEQCAFMQRVKLSLPPGVLPASVPDIQDDESKNEEHGFDTPTHDDDADPQPKILGILGVQKILATMGVYRGALDGVYGPQTKQAVIVFQSKWNSTHPKDPKLDVDGIPGPMTCKALQTP